MKSQKHWQRRQLLATAGAGLFMGANQALAAPDKLLTPTGQAFDGIERHLNLHNLHTGELYQGVFWQNGHFIDEEVDNLWLLLRDHYNDEVGAIDAQAIDLLWKLQRLAQEHLGKSPTLHIVSAFRSEQTNNALRAKSSGVAKKSLHMQGRAIDLRVDGLSTQQLFRLARSLKMGGVGRYLKSGFIHVDTGRVRFWG